MTTARRFARPVIVVSVSLVVLLAVAGWFRLRESEPMDDMRRQADVVALPKDFELVIESYSEGATGWFGSVPQLHRIYHASWPAVCDSLRDLGARLGEPTGLAPVPRENADQMCNCGAWVKAGWRGRIRNYSRYEVRLTARRPGSFEGPMFEHARGFTVLYPTYEPMPGPKIVIPEGRARVEVDLIAHRGQ
ncbi:MAG TPA: hypothetical protein VFQ05_01960 [Candidatus Eisenbacteria bacterium]|nr:hypothetical protein [Candidatus Eisenbacteria bacterium]